MPKILGFSIENCDTSEVFKNKKYPKILKENVWEFAWDRVLEGHQSPSNAKFRYIRPLLNFQFLKTLPVPQFSILITQIFGITNFHPLSPFLEFTEYYISVFD